MYDQAMSIPDAPDPRRVQSVSRAEPPERLARFEACMDADGRIERAVGGSRRVRSRVR